MVTQMKTTNHMTLPYEPKATYYYYISTVENQMEEIAEFPHKFHKFKEIWGSGCRYILANQDTFVDMAIEKEINVDNLVAAMDATESEVEQWLEQLLEDYDIESTDENINAAKSLIRLWLEQQLSKNALRLEEDELSKLFRFTVRLAYEALYVGSASL